MLELLFPDPEAHAHCRSCAAADVAPLIRWQRRSLCWNSASSPLGPQKIWRRCVPGELLRWFGSMFYKITTYRDIAYTVNIIYIIYTCIYAIRNKGRFVEKLWVADGLFSLAQRSLCPVGMCLKRSWSHILTSPKIIVSGWHLREVEKGQSRGRVMVE